MFVYTHVWQRQRQDAVPYQNTLTPTFICISIQTYVEMYVTAYVRNCNLSFYSSHHNSPVVVVIIPVVLYA